MLISLTQPYFIFVKHVNGAPVKFVFLQNGLLERSFWRYLTKQQPPRDTLFLELNVPGTLHTVRDFKLKRVLKLSIYK